MLHKISLVEEDQMKELVMKWEFWKGFENNTSLKWHKK